MSLSIEAGEDYFAHPTKQPRPYVRFEMRMQEVRDNDGNKSFRDTPWVKITPAGGRDVLEKPVADWLRDLEAHAQNGRVPAEWPHEYKRAFEAWKAGEELPVNGYPIKLWAPLSPAQRAAVLNANILTVEDLALANDEAKGRIGMGGVGLVQLAQAWVEDRKGAGSLAARLEAAVQGRLAAEARVKDLEEQVKVLEMLVPADKRPKAPEKPSGQVVVK